MLILILLVLTGSYAGLWALRFVLEQRTDTDSLEGTCNINNSLRKSEINQINMNSKKDNFSKKLTTEEELYDEFNYLLDE